MDIQKDIDEAITDLETLTDEIRVKIHLAGMDAKDAWQKLEPRIDDARKHAKEATEASRSAIKETLAALRTFRTRL